MHKQIFVNLPVADLKRSVAFFTRLGFTLNPQFTDEHDRRTGKRHVNVVEPRGR